MATNWRPAGPARSRVPRAVAAFLLGLGLLGLVGACGFGAQTLQPYTPAEGTNADIGQGGTLKIRNLVVVSRTKGQGIISATLVSNASDRLTGVTVAPTRPDGSTAPGVAAALPKPITLGSGSLVVLTDMQPLITVAAPDLQPGLTATITLQFANAGPVTMNAPVVDGTTEPWSTITPAPSPSGSASASPSPSASS